MITSEKHQKALLGGVERLAGVTYPDLVPLIPKILMAFYQVDVLEEEVIKQWGTHVSKKYVDKDTSKRVRKASEPFLKVRTFPHLSLCEGADMGEYSNSQWLDEAEESEEESDDE